MQRVNIVGTSGSGKSVFGKRLAEILDYDFVEMDSIFWGKDWSQSTDDEFFESLEKALSGTRWVLDGNYTKTIPIKWAKTDTVIWLDYSFTRTFYQAITRAIYRSNSGRELWTGTGNVETFKQSFFSKDSVILWTIKTYRANRIKYLAIMDDELYSYINFVRIRNPNEAQEYIDKVHIERKLNQ